MGKKGNQMRKTRRSREAAIIAQKYLQDKVNGVVTDQEDIEMERAYAGAIREEFGETTVTEPNALTVVEPPLSLRDRWKVIISEDHALDYPDLTLEVFINGTEYEEPAFAEWMMRATCRRATTLEEADLCVFTGGADVDPVFYGARKHDTTKIDTRRDERDLIVYKECYDQGIPMLGICRGAQFLHVMNGGRLYQDIDGHVGNHKIVDLEQRRVIDRISSVHHQSCIPNLEGGMRILATASQSRKRVKYDNELEEFVTELGIKPDVEAFFYPETCCLGVQGHPEYKTYNAFSVWVLNLINRWVIENPDVDFVNNVRRLRPDILGMRSLAEGKK